MEAIFTSGNQTWWRQFLLLKEIHYGASGRKGTGAHRRDLWRCGSSPRPDARSELAARRPVALRPVHRQRRGQDCLAGYVARHKGPGDRQHQPHETGVHRGGPAELLLTEWRHPEIWRQHAVAAARTGLSRPKAVNLRAFA